jgi:hypothetical protein
VYHHVRIGLRDLRSMVRQSFALECFLRQGSGLRQRLVIIISYIFARSNIVNVIGLDSDLTHIFEGFWGNLVMLWDLSPSLHLVLRQCRPTLTVYNVNSPTDKAANW